MLETRACLKIWTDRSFYFIEKGSHSHSDTALKIIVLLMFPEEELNLKDPVVEILKLMGD